MASLLLYGGVCSAEEDTSAELPANLFLWSTLKNTSLITLRSRWGAPHNRLEKQDSCQGYGGLLDNTACIAKHGSSATKQQSLLAWARRAGAKKPMFAGLSVVLS